MQAPRQAIPSFAAALLQASRRSVLAVRFGGQAFALPMNGLRSRSQSEGLDVILILIRVEPCQSLTSLGRWRSPTIGSAANRLVWCAMSVPAGLD